MAPPRSRRCPDARARGPKVKTLPGKARTSTAARRVPQRPAARRDRARRSSCRAGRRHGRLRPEAPRDRRIQSDGRQVRDNMLATLQTGAVRRRGQPDDSYEEAIDDLARGCGRATSEGRRPRQDRLGACAIGPNAYDSGAGWADNRSVVSSRGPKPRSGRGDSQSRGSLSSGRTPHVVVRLPSPSHLRQGQGRHRRDGAGAGAALGDERERGAGAERRPPSSMRSGCRSRWRRRRQRSTAAPSRTGPPRGGEPEDRAGRSPSPSSRSASPTSSALPSPGVGFDCSGLIEYAYEQAGIKTPGRLTPGPMNKMGKQIALEEHPARGLDRARLRRYGPRRHVHGQRSGDRCPADGRGRPVPAALQVHVQQSLQRPPLARRGVARGSAGGRGSAPRASAPPPPATTAPVSG